MTMLWLSPGLASAAASQNHGHGFAARPLTKRLMPMGLVWHGRCDGLATVYLFLARLEH